MGDYARNLMSALAPIDGFSAARVLVPEEVKAECLVSGWDYVRNGHFTTLSDRHAFDQKSTADFLNTVRPDLFHSLYASLPAALCPGLKIVTVGDMIPRLVRRYASPYQAVKLKMALAYNGFLPLISRIANERGIRKADAILTFSECSKRDIVQCLDVDPDRVKVIPIGVDPELKPASEEDTRNTLHRYGVLFPYILYVGGFHPHKNVLRLIDAYARLSEGHRRSVKLVVVGENVPPRVQRLVAKRKLQKDVVYTGAIAREDRARLYSGARLLAYPSLYEGFGLPPLEAMSCGCPVVTSNTSSLLEVVGDAALTVSPTSISSISDAIARLIEDDSFAKALAERGLRQAQTFSWDHCVRETRLAYRAVMSGRKVADALYA